MRYRRILLLACVIVAVSSCAREQSCEFSRGTISGAYSVTIQRPNGTQEGTAILRGAGDSVSGSLEVSGLPPLQLVRVRADSNRLTATAVGGGVEAALEWTFTGSEYTGELRAGERVIAMNGRRLPPCGGDRVAAVAPRQMDLDALARRLADSVPEWLNRYNGAGLAIAIVDGCALRWSATFGVADAATGRRVSDSTLFGVGSISKTFAAWAVMTLVEEGKVNLDAPVQRYLEQWRLPPSPHDADQVTVRRLLSHTAGVNVPSALGISLPVRRPTLEELVNGRVKEFENQKVEIVDPPGTRYRYSGGGYEILQFMVEDVTGERFADYVTRRILVPLGMTASTFDWSERVAASVAIPYKEDGVETFPQLVYPAAAAAGLYSTLDDMTRFLLAHCGREGGERAAGSGVVSPSTLTLMMRPDAVAIQYGLGYEQVPINGIPVAGHSGSNPGWKANFLVMPERGFGFVVLANIDGGRARAQAMSSIRDAIGTNP